jgi:hypothetical protein
VSLSVPSGDTTTHPAANATMSATHIAAATSLVFLRLPVILYTSIYSAFENYFTATSRKSQV